MKVKIFALVLGLSLLAAACNQTSTSTNPTPTPTPTPTSTEVQSGTVTIEMTDSGFSPSDITVKSGTVVTFKNTGSKPRWPASNPHPSHTDLPGFDSLKGLANGGTYSFTFTKVGKWKFHDHLNATLGGSVTVVE